MSNPKGNPSTLKSYKPKWQSGPTQVIRIPIALADKLLEVAQKLDNNEPVSTDVSIEIEDAIKDVLADPAVTRNGRDAGAARRALSALQSRLK
jgi:hypothetical protein